MPDLRRISVAACVLLVILRMSIGWQLFYEGIWKYRTLKTANAWSAEGYLKNSRGPLRNTFRNMAGDPDDLQWLDAKAVSARWDAWQKRFVIHYGLDEAQRSRLNLLVNGRKEYSVELDQLPEGVAFGGPLAKSLRYDADKKRLIVPADWHMTPPERDRARALAPPDPSESAGAPVNAETDPAKLEAQSQQVEVARKYRDALERLYALQSRLSYKERLKATLVGNPANSQQNVGEIALYRKQLARYEDKRAHADQDFQNNHLQKQWGELQQQRAALVGPVKALDSELQRDARALLSTSQLRLGPVHDPMVQIDWVNTLTMGALIVCGFLLISGLLSRIAAAGAALLLFTFYLAMPPWPWLPGFGGFAGPDHSFLVDKNLIEVFALTAIALLPTGSWFGLDALFTGWWTRWRAASAPPSPIDERLRETPPTRETLIASAPGKPTRAT